MIRLRRAALFDSKKGNPQVLGLGNTGSAVEDHALEIKRRRAMRGVAIPPASDETI